MTGPEGALGVVLETMSWVGLVPGIPLLLFGWILALRACKWIATTAEVFEAGGFQGFRWFDSDGRQHSILHEPSEAPIMEVGAHVTLYYDQCHPSRWRLARPRRTNAAMIIGSILTGIGLLSVVAGFALMAF
ncbi:MAG: hypothetical protein ACSHW9_00545 [Salinibacterium amurskyense]